MSTQFVRSLSRGIRLSGEERRLLMTALLWSGAVRMSLRLLSFRVVLRWVERLATPTSRATATDPSYRERAAWAVSAVGHRLFPRNPCLTEAFVAQLMLRRRGFPATLRIGVATDEGRFKAHAWVESEGRIIVGGSASPEHFTPLPPLRV